MVCARTSHALSVRQSLHAHILYSVRQAKLNKRSINDGGQRSATMRRPSDPLSLSPPSSLPHFLVCRSRSFFSPLHPCPHPPLPNPGATHGGGGAATVCTCNCSSGRAHKRVQLNGWKEGVGLKKKYKKRIRTTNIVFFRVLPPLPGMWMEVAALQPPAVISICPHYETPISINGESVRQMAARLSNSLIAV